MSTTSVEKKESKTSQTEGEKSSPKASKKSSDSLVGFAFGEESIPEEEEKVVEEKEKEERSTFFTHKYVKTTVPEYRREELKKQPLFSEVLTLEKDAAEVSIEKQSEEEPSILVTGFGIRNLESLQDALREEQRRYFELHGHGSSREEGSFSTLSSRRLGTPLTKRSSETETDRSSVRMDLSAQRMQLEYLLGLETEAEEEHVEEEKVEEEAEEEFVYSTSKSIKNAQKYLRVHRIFDFFQVIIAHLLSALPENPVDFILVYLNKCLCYRSGLGRPPLLYEQKHIEQLYKLMDRMDIGFIDLEQYEKAMTTLGICEYNKNPPTTDDLVHREFFIQEALESETALFDDLIKRKWIGTKPPSEPRILNYLHRTDSGPYFIPSDLLLKLRPYQLQDLGMIEEGEEDQGGFHFEVEGEEEEGG